MDNYKAYLRNIQLGYHAEPARENMPATLVVPSLKMNFEFDEGFPILTGKQMPIYSIIGELICFMQGRTDVRDFENLGCSVWWDNAYNWNVKRLGHSSIISQEEYKRIGMEKYTWTRFGEKVSSSDSYANINGRLVGYDLGKIYSYYWAYQFPAMLDSIRSKPFSRYHVMDSWRFEEMNPAHTSQPNCHVYYQATCAINHSSVASTMDYLSKFLTHGTIGSMTHYFTEAYGYKSIIDAPLIFGHLTQRSCDAFLGVPFNITSYSLFTILVGILTGTVPIAFNWVGVNNHIYGNHKDAVDTYLNRPTHALPKIDIDINGINTLNKLYKISNRADVKDIFRLMDYIHEDKIKAPLSVGL